MLNRKPGVEPICFRNESKKSARNLAELKTVKQNADAVQLGRKWKAHLFLCDALCLTGCLHLAQHLYKASAGIHSEEQSLDNNLMLNVAFSAR